jgi:RNA polymerase sigma-70 factor (ECF subfamily)
MTSRQAADSMRVERADTDEGALSGVALAAFVEDHHARLLRLAYLICRDASDAADAVQVSFEQAWRRRSSLLNDASLRPWLDRIVVREAIRISKARRAWLVRIFVPRTSVAWIETADPRSDGHQQWTALRAAFAKLSAEQRAVVALHLHAGYSVAETAGIVGAPIETVRSRLRLAKDRLRRELEEVEQ